MERRRFLTLTAGGMTAAAATAAAATAYERRTSEDGSTPLTLVAADYGAPGSSGSRRYWTRLARAFEKENPGIAVEVSVHGWQDIDRRVAQMVSEDRAPDIAQIGAYAEYAAEERLYRASELLSIPVQADFLPGLAAAGEQGRVQYGLPFVASTRRLFYNKTLFKKAGLDPETPPESWKELASTARALKAADVPIPYGLPLGPEEAPAETLLWSLSGGGGYTDNLGRYTLDSAENIGTFRWIRDNLVSAELTGPNPARTNRQKLFDAFCRGEVGMLNGHPALIPQALGAGVSYGTGTLPGRGGPADSTLGVADWIMAFRQRGHREEAGKFLEFAFRERHHYAFITEYGLLPVTNSASHRMQEDEDQRRLRSFLTQLPAAEFYPVDKVSWGKVSAEIKKSVGEAATPGADPRRVLGRIQRRAKAAETSTEDTPTT